MSRVCVKCGGSWTGKAYDTACGHDFGEAPEPTVEDGWPLGDGEREIGFLAWGPDPRNPPCDFEAEHPTREGAIALWKAAWRERRERVVGTVTRKPGGWVKLSDVAKREPVGTVTATDGDTCTVTLGTGTYVHPGALVTRAELREAARSELAATFTVNYSAPVVSAATYAELGAQLKASTEPRAVTKCDCNMHGQEEEEGEWCSDPDCRRKRYQERRAASAAAASEPASHQAYLGKPAGEWPAWAIDDFMYCARAKPCGCGSIDWANAAVYGDGSAGQTTYVLACRQCGKGRAHHA